MKQPSLHTFILRRNIPTTHSPQFGVQKEHFHSQHMFVFATLNHQTVICVVVSGKNRINLFVRGKKKNHLALYRYIHKNTQETNFSHRNDVIFGLLSIAVFVCNHLKMFPNTGADGVWTTSNCDFMIEDCRVQVSNGSRWKNLAHDSRVIGGKEKNMVRQKLILLYGSVEVFCYETIEISI